MEITKANKEALKEYQEKMGDFEACLRVISEYHKKLTEIENYTHTIRVASVKADLSEIRNKIRGMKNLKERREKALEEKPSEKEVEEINKGLGTLH